MARVFLGIDVSTTGAKALLVDEKGVVVAAATTPLTLSTPKPLWSEQDPHEWWTGVTRSIQGALAQAKVGGADVAAVGLTGQMHGLVLLDGDQRVLRPAILWNDQRTGAQCDEIRTRMGGRGRLVQVTGNDALTGFTAPKILWVRENEPDVYARARLVLLPKDYVRLRLTGVAAMDKADGSGTLLFDLAARDWSAEVQRALDIPRAWLPPTNEGPEVTGRITAEAAAATGLREGTPVMAGGGDQAAGAVGAGAITPGVVSLTLGTSGVVFATTDAPLVEPEGRLHAFCHAVPGKWHLMGVTLSAAGSLQWYRDTLAPGESFDALVEEAGTAPAGSEGLIFLPYLSGERTPYPDPLARGAFVGLTVRHRRAHLTRAVLEGVAFSMRDCMGLFAQAGLASVKQVRVAGGGARSALWRKILASVLGAELVTVNSTEGAAYGAALLAGVGAGAWKDVAAACESAIAVTGRDGPDTQWQRTYDQLYPRYRALYPALKSE
jgi:xylulokinase